MSASPVFLTLASSMTPMPVLELDCTVARTQDQLSGDVDGEVVLLNIERGEYFHFNDAGSRVWDCVEAPTSIGTIVDQLLEEFDVERGECERAVLEFLRKLLAEGLVRVSDPIHTRAGSQSMNDI
jgi:hypothetical protein